jgi:polyhydroxybutyrate depolymerase
MGLAVAMAAGAACAGDYETRALRWDSLERSYLIHLPPDAAGDPLPLVIALHGAGGNAQGFADETRMAAAADASGMMVAFPDGVGGTFNAQFCCGEAVTRQVDDIGFIGAIIDDVSRHWTLDRTRVYVTGMSNGGILTYELAAIHPDWFAAIAPVSGAIGGVARSGKTYLIPVPDRPVPVMIIHGMRDHLVLYDGGSSSYLKFTNHWKMSVADSFTFWAAADRCDGQPDTREIVPGKLRSSTYAGCAEGTTVRLWSVEDGEHGWPDDIFPAEESTRSAAAEILAFFAGFRRIDASGADR